MDMWMEVKVEQCLVKLFFIIQSICQKYYKIKQSTMAIFKTDMVLYSMWVKVHVFLAEFIQLFKAQVSIINSHRSMSGYHPKIYKYKFSSNCKAANMVYKDTTTKVQ